MARWSCRAAIVGFLLLPGAAAGQSLAALGWNVATVQDQRPAEFTLVDDAIQVLADRGVAFLYRELAAPEASSTCLNWLWTVLEAMPPTDLAKPGADDRPLAVHLIFPYSEKASGLFTSIRRRIVARRLGGAFAGRMVTYVWGGVQPAGSWLPNPFLPGDAALGVLRSGGEPLGSWQTERVGFRADYERQFGEPAPDPTHVVISGDSDDTRSRSLGYVRNLAFDECGDPP